MPVPVLDGTLGEDGRMGEKMKFLKEKWKIAALGAAELLLFFACVWAQVSGGRETYAFTGGEVPFYREEPTEAHAPLARGSYRVTVVYEAGEESVSRVAVKTSHGTDYRDNILFLQEAQEKSFELRLSENTESFYLLGGSKTFQVKSMTLEETGQAGRVDCFLLLGVMALADLLIYWHRRGWWEKLSEEKKNAALGIAFIAVAATVPLFTDYLLEGSDLSFHIMRIEGLAEGLGRGDFPVKMQPLWLNDYGYPVSVMYGDLLLYIPAVLRLIGFPLQTVYKIYVFLINLLTAAAVFYCSKRMSGNYRNSLAIAFMYTLAGYRLTNIYHRAALGEFTAMAFFPLVFFGLWQLFWRDGKKERRESIVILMAGYTGILQSHLLSFEIAVFFSLFYCLMHGRKFLRQFKTLVVTGIATILLNLGWLVPMLEYMRTQDMRIVGNAGYELQDFGLFFPQLFQIFTFSGGNFGYAAPVTYGIGDEILVGVGISWIFVLLLYVWEHLVHGKRIAEKSGAERQASVRIFLMLLLSISVTCYFFPWGIIQAIPEIGSLLTPYQFVCRFTAVALVFGAMLAVYAFRSLDRIVSAGTKRGIILTLCLLTFLGSAHYMEKRISECEPLRIAGVGGIDTRGAVLNGEYLLKNTYELSVNNVEPWAEEGCIIDDYSKEDGVMTVCFRNTKETEACIKLPFFAYLGYRAVDPRSGYGFFISRDYQNVGMVVVPAGYEGVMQVYFEEPAAWRVAEGISLLAFAALAGGFLYVRRKEKRMMRKE